MPAFFAGDLTKNRRKLLGPGNQRQPLEPLPVRSWDVRRAPSALRFMAQARHTGKLVLTMPAPIVPAEASVFTRGTVLISGGTGTLGALVARHLVAHHGARHLILCSRSGRADALRAELQAHGAEVDVAACDVADRAALQSLIEAIPEAHPLCAVFHAAGVVDDGVLLDQNPERLRAVFGPKLVGAWNLHELCRAHDLAAFVLFSSVAGVLGAPGQSNYAAGNAFLDALARERRAQGLAATSLSWGLWAEASGITGQLGPADLSRMARAGMEALTSEQGLALLDAALAREPAHWIAARFNLTALANRSEPLHPLLRGLVHKRPRRTSTPALSAASLKAQLTGLPSAEQQSLLLEIVGGIAATVLGSKSGKLAPDQPLSELGLDSLMAVELRNQLAAVSGLRLSPTLLFNHPTTGQLATFLHAELLPPEQHEDSTQQVLRELDRLEARLPELSSERGALLLARLEGLARRLRFGADDAASAAQNLAEEVELFDDEQLFKLVDQSIGKVGEAE